MNTKKILIIGTSGSGKTTLGKRISYRTGYPQTDLDDLYWKPNWEEKDQQKFRSLVSDVVAKDSWIITGNYSKTSQELIWPFADMVIWLDFPMGILLIRALKRSLKRIVKKESCCNGNYETFFQLFGPYSILWWIIKSNQRRKKEYGSLFNDPIYQNKKLMHITHKSQMDELMNEINF